jgi:superfamily I DNA/RNA helicase
MTNLDSIYSIDDRPLAFENHRAGLLISLAGPGTGKTYSFLRRIRALETNQNIQPEEICYLTFIKDISRAFLSDYQEEFPVNLDDISKPRISTLHSFACRLIRNRGFSLGYDGQLYFTSIADPESSASQVLLDDLLPLINSIGLKTRSRLFSSL